MQAGKFIRKSASITAAAVKDVVGHSDSAFFPHAGEF
jgi:hypothetical protein